jgi:uncharacterized protein (TIGR02265 family)
MGRTPLIKGMFINSHIERLRREKGAEAVYDLNLHLGIFTGFNNFDDYPVSLEIKVLEFVLESLEGAVPPGEKAFEAGRLHFRDFAETVFGRLTMGIVPRSPEGFRRLMAMANYIGSYVFKNTDFSTRLVGDTAVQVVMENNDYPIDHFRGLFCEWAVFWGLSNPSVTAKETAPKRFEYTVTWEDGWNEVTH